MTDKLEIVKEAKLSFGGNEATIKPYVDDDGNRHVDIDIVTIHGTISLKGQETEDGKVILSGETEKETFSEVVKVVKEKALAIKLLNAIQQTLNRPVQIERTVENYTLDRMLPERF